jgi:AcrR family transcriptional regulator
VRVVPVKRGVVLAEVIRVLPRRSPLSRRAVRDSQKWRMLEAITEVVAKHGYGDASVADVIDVAGVSRRTFYEHFSDKEDCFLTAYEVLSSRLVESMKTAGATKPSGAGRRRAQIEKFIAVLEHEPLSARVFMVDVLGAGMRALRAREDVNARFALAVLGPAVSPLRRAAIVGAVNAVIVGKLLDRQVEELPRLVSPLCSFIERALVE